MQENINFNVTTDDGWTPIHLVCRIYKHPNLIKFLQLLISNELDANAITSKGWNSLHFLLRNINFFINEGIDLIEPVAYLLYHECNVNATTSLRWTPLHFVRQYYDGNQIPIKLIQYLVNSGADLHAVRSDGCTPLDLLAERVVWSFANLFKAIKTSLLAAISSHYS